MCLLLHSQRHPLQPVTLSLRLRAGEGGANAGGPEGSVAKKLEMKA